MLELKINVRHSNTGGTIRTVTRLNNFKYNHAFNSMASTFSFDYYFDPDNQEDAEVVCVSHMHECQLFYNKKLFLTGYILSQQFVDNGKPEYVKISGYSKAGALTDCDTNASKSLETDGLTFRQIINKVLAPFKSNGIGLVYGKGTGAINKVFTDDEKSIESKLDDNGEAKVAKETSQNIASYLSELAKQRNIVLSHDEKGNVLITTPNTKGKPILNLDFSDNTSDAFKIPGIGLDFTFNGQALHTEITVVQQADEEMGKDASTFGPRRNPLIPIKKEVLYRPRTVIVDSGNEFTLNEACNYEMGKEVREAVKLKVDLGTANIEGLLIAPNNTITVKKRSIFAYKKITWFIESMEIGYDSEKEVSTLNCVLPFGYDFNYANLKNNWVDPHDNLPKF